MKNPPEGFIYPTYIKNKLYRGVVVSNLEVPPAIINPSEINAYKNIYVLSSGLIN